MFKIRLIMKTIVIIIISYVTIAIVIVNVITIIIKFQNFIYLSTNLN